jgi:hypothetical protein
MGKTSSMNSKHDKLLQNFVRQYERSRLLLRRRRKWKIILEMGFKELRAGDLLSIHWLCQPFVNTVPVHGFHKNKQIAGLCVRILGYIL